MKVNVDRKALADATKAAGKFLGARLAIPALNHFLVEAHSGMLAITATDHEAGRRVEIEAEVEDEGDILVPPSLAKIVSGSNASNVSIRTDESEAVLTVGKARAKLRLGRRDDYPDAEPDETGAAEIPVSNWSHLKQVCVAASTDQTRPVYAGVQIANGTAAATDTYRLAWVDVAEGVEHPEALIPARAIQALDANVEKLYVTDRHVKAKLEDGAWWTRRIEGTYAKWRNLLPKEDQIVTRVTFDSDLIVSAVKRAVGALGPHFVRISIHDGEVEVKATMQDQGEYSEVIAAKTEGDSLVAHFNPAFLIDAFGATEVATMALIDDVRPALITSAWWAYLLMPVRT